MSTFLRWGLAIGVAASVLLVQIATSPLAAFAEGDWG